MRTDRRLVYWIIVHLLLTVLPVTAVLQGAPLRYFAVKLSGSYRFGYLYIDGRYYGRINRGATRWIRLRGGYYYRMTVRYGTVRHDRREYLPAQSNKTVHFSLPAPRVAASGSIKVVLRGRYSRVRLYLNGSFQGQLYRNRPRVLRVASGRTWLVQAREGGLIRSRKVYVGRAGRLQQQQVTLSF